MTQGSGARIMVDRHQEGGPDTLRIITITGGQAQIDIALVSSKAICLIP